LSTCNGESRFSDQALAELEAIVSHYPERKAAVLPALYVAQREYGGWLPAAALAEVARLTGRPLTEVQGVATYYTMYNLQPRGRHHLEVCTCLTCGCLGAYDVLHRICAELGVAPGEVTDDGAFSVAEAECLNWCAEPTVVQVGDRYFTGLCSDDVPAWLRELRGSDAHTVVAQADSVVRAILPATERPGRQVA